MRLKPKHLDRVWAVGLLSLIAVTWRLWIPRADAFEVPMVSGVSSLPHFVGWLPIFVLTLATIWIVIAGYRWLWWLVAAALLASFVMNQHRLQPWAYQTAIYATVFASMNRAQARDWLRPLAASVYLYSAAGKFDFQFTHTVGQHFLETMMDVVGGVPESWSEPTRVRLAILFPASEMIVGIGLLVPRTRRVAGGLAIAFHLTLVLVLGPWGLDHSDGVLVWNVVLMAQAYLLFVARDQETERTHEFVSRASIIAKTAVMIALIAPLGERRGYWDHWPSWALYSPHSSRVEVEVHESGTHKIDSSIREYFAETSANDRWRVLAMDQWSLQQLGVPIYPQARFQLAVADGLAREHELGSAIRVIVRGVSQRWTSERGERRLIGEKEIREAMQQYWLVGR